MGLDLKAFSCSFVMGIFRRVLEWRPFRLRERREVKTLGQTIDVEKRHISEVTAILEQKMKISEVPETEYQVILHELHLAFGANPIVARESNQTAQTVLNLFRTTRMPRVKILCARILLTMHSARNPVVVSKLSTVLQEETNPQIRAFFKNINF